LALIVLLRNLKLYVEGACGNDPAVLLSSGFQAAATIRNYSSLASPAILSVDFGNSSELVLKVTPIAREVLRSAVRGGGRRQRSRALATLRPVHQIDGDDDLRSHAGIDLCFPGPRHRRINRS
jgi:hypothetical protein